MLAVFDVDGVVADVRHRLHYLDPPRSWGRFFAEADADGLLAEGARLAAELAETFDVVWLSGRPEWLRETTRGWLARNNLPGTEIHLRPNRDHRPARLFKREALRRLSERGIAAFVDDDEAVVEDARLAGYPAVLADWMPKAKNLRHAQQRLGRT